MGQLDLTEVGERDHQQLQGEEGSDRFSVDFFFIFYFLMCVFNSFLQSPEIPPILWGLMFPSLMGLQALAGWEQSLG